MSQKRKFEEYHDPDYLQSNSKIAKLSFEESVKETDKKQKVVDIITNEFEIEINNKEREVYEINHRIFLVRKMLHKVCFAVISNYYNKRNLNLAPDKVAKAQESISRFFKDDRNGLQNVIHPSLKKILGSNEVNYKELLNSRPVRQAARTAQSTIKEKFKTKKELRIERQRIKALESIQENTTVDECLNLTTTVTEKLDSINENRCNNIKDDSVFLQKPLDKVLKLNTDRGVNLSKQIIAVGNTSKFIQKDDLQDKVTHKWLIYVQSKTEIPIEKFVKKVRFYLHPSYKPNDIVDVESPPFQLARRGWGEFPVRIQLYFYSKFQQKPVQFYHNLILDKTLTGLQTMGSETLVELWLRSILFSPEKLKLPENSSDNCQYYINYTNGDCAKVKEGKSSPSLRKGTSISPLIECKDNLIDFLNDIDSSIATDPDSIEPTLILSPTTHTKLKISEAINSPNIQTTYTQNSDHSAIIEKTANEFLATMKVENPDFVSGKQNETADFGIVPLNIKQINDKLKETLSDGKEIIPIKQETLENDLEKGPFGIQVKSKVEQNNNYTNQRNHIILKDGKVSIINPYQSKLKKRKQISLLKPVIKQNQSNTSSNSSKTFQNSCLIDHDYTSPWKNKIISNNELLENGLKEEKKDNTLDNLKEQLEDSSLINSDDFISVVISDNTKQLVNLKKKITLTVKDKPFPNEKPFIDYRGKFELKFHSKTFSTEDNLVEYCLKNVPLIDPRAADDHYKTAFPFVRESLATFRTLLLPKRKSLEWLQCKYFSTLMKNHDQFSETAWSTKEIILFARSYGFTSLQNNKLQIKIFKNIASKDSKFDQNQNKHSTKSLEEIYKWINEYSKNIENFQDTEKINIEDETDAENIKQQTNKNLFPLTFSEHSTIIPVEEKFEKDSKLIKEICRNINISLKPEPVFQDVHLHVSELMIIKLFRKFLENLVRKSLFEIRNLNETQSIPTIEIEHVKNALMLNPEFEFLTNLMH